MAQVGTLEMKTVRGARIYEWLLAADGYGEAVEVPHLADKTYAMLGTWDGATIILQGGFDKDDGTALMATLHESDNTTAISNTADAIGVVLENPIWIRPIMSAKGATTSVKIILVAK